MKTSTVVIWVIVIVVIVLGGWWWYSSSQGTVSSTTDTTDTTQTNTTALNVSTDPTLGNYLVAPSGMSLYMFNKDSVGTSTCYGDCATEWPPYTVVSGTDLMAPTGATGTVATITRTDGTMQVTYNGMPLYFFADDTQPGDTTGQNKDGFFVVAP